jgi:hypothetical protein
MEASIDMLFVKEDGIAKEKPATIIRFPVERVKGIENYLREQKSARRKNRFLSNINDVIRGTKDFARRVRNNIHFKTLPCYLAVVLTTGACATVGISYVAAIIKANRGIRPSNEFIIETERYGNLYDSIAHAIKGNESAKRHLQKTYGTENVREIIWAMVNDMRPQLERKGRVRNHDVYHVKATRDGVVLLEEYNQDNIQPYIETVAKKAKISRRKFVSKHLADVVRAEVPYMLETLKMVHGDIDKLLDHMAVTYIESHGEGFSVSRSGDAGRKMLQPGVARKYFDMEVKREWTRILRQERNKLKKGNNGKWDPEFSKEAMLRAAFRLKKRKGWTLYELIHNLPREYDQRLNGTLSTRAGIRHFENARHGESDSESTYGNYWRGIAGFQAMQNEYGDSWREMNRAATEEESEFRQTRANIRKYSWARKALQRCRPEIEGIIHELQTADEEDREFYRENYPNDVKKLEAEIMRYARRLQKEKKREALAKKGPAPRAKQKRKVAHSQQKPKRFDRKMQLAYNRR